MKNTFLIFIFIIICLVGQYTRANELIIADTSLSRMYPAEIYLKGKLDKPADSIKITLRFDISQLMILGVESNSNNIVMEEKPEYYVWGPNPQEHDLVVSSKNINPDGTIFFKIKLQALLSKDSIFTLEPIRLELNGVVDTECKFLAGKFRSGNGGFISEKTDIGYFYPNPFGYESRIELNLVKSAKLNIAIYKASGQLLYEVNEDTPQDEFIFLNEKYEIFYFEPQKNLEAGRYYFIWQPKKKILASEPYFVIFKIGDEILQSNVMLTR